MESARDRLKKIASKKTSTWVEEAKWRAENEGWLDYSFAIAVKVLSALRTQKMSQKDLAGILNVSPQHINKIVKGSENLTIETIAKLESALGIKLIDVPLYSQVSPYQVSSFYRSSFGHFMATQWVASKTYETAKQESTFKEGSQQYKIAS